MAQVNPSDTVAGRYELQEEVGRGGFGVVWRARDGRTGREVALKHPNYEGRAGDDLVDTYFQRELEVLEDIREVGGHPNIMSYHGATEDGTRFLVVELIEGEEIGDLVQGDPMTDIDEVRQVGIGICDALSFLHDHDIIYRDLKPDNIIIDGAGEPKIIDFTTAKGFFPEDNVPEFTTGEGDSGDSTVPGEFKPPELNEGATQRQGPWSDVYSVGKILCFLLVGWVPDGDEVSPGDFGVEVPRYLDQIIATATKADRRDRYPNAAVLRRALAEKDPSMPEQATIRWLGADERFTISPGDTIGRDHPDGPQPSVVLDDDEHRALSAVHCRFEVDDDGTWRVVDTSLNGTHVSKHDERSWELLLSDAGRRRREQMGESFDTTPPAEAELEDGDVVALVDPNYPERFYFQFSHDAY
jgi:serine/threonine protein kinase